jgi:uncharacterized protein YejL (UPF0352 family)
MANKKVTVEVDIDSNLDPTIANLKKLKQQLKETAAGSAEFNKLSAQIRDMDDAIKDASKTSDDFAGYLENASGPLGMLGRGLRAAEQNFSSFNAILKTSVIGILVTAIGGLVAAFSQSEVAVKKLQPLMIGLEKILGGIFRAFEPVLDIFIEMATTALPYITKGIGVFYSAIFGLFSFIKNTALGVGKILEGVFTLDFDKVGEGFNKLSNVIGDSMDSAKAAFGRFEGGTKELTKTEKEQLSERTKNNQDAANKQKELEKQKLEALKADLDAKIKLETDSENTNRQKLKALLDERYKAEISDKKLSDAQKLVLQQEYAKKLEDAIKADDDKRKAEEEKRKKDRIAELDAMIQLEIDKANTSREELKFILDAKMQEELSNVELGEAQKEVIRQKYAKQLKDAIDKDEKDRRDKRIKELQELLRLSEGNADEQIRITQELQNELKTIEDPTERFQLQKGYQDNLLTLLDTSYSNQKATIESKYGDFKRFDAQYYEDQRQALEKNQTDLKNALDKGTITKEQFTARDKQLALARREIGKQEVASNQEKTKLISDALGQLSTIVGQDTIAGKSFAIAKATIDTYQSAVAAYKSLSGIPVIGPALGAIAAAAAVASGIATVKKIVAVQVPNAPSNPGGNATQTTPGTPGERPLVNVSASAPSPVGRAQGGIVRGGGGMFTDSIPAMLSDGEFVVNSRSTRMFQPLLQSINDSANLPQFAVGGMVSNNNRPQQDNTETIVNAIQQTFGDTPIRTYVTAGDISTQQQFDRVIKSRSLI